VYASARCVCFVFVFVFFSNPLVVDLCSPKETDANATSSRSHAAMLLRLVDRASGEPVGKFSLIDLAGAERGADHESSNKKTQARGRGPRFLSLSLSLSPCLFLFFFSLALSLSSLCALAGSPNSLRGSDTTTTTLELPFELHLNRRRKAARSTRAYSP
jgi:hypothetical protein